MRAMRTFAVVCFLDTMRCALIAWVLVGWAGVSSGEPGIQEGAYTLNVSIRSRTADGTEPVVGAVVKLSGPQGAEGGGVISNFEMITDAEGTASVRLKLRGTYSIETNHPGFEPAKSNVTVDNPAFPMSFQQTLRRKGVVTQYKLVVKVSSLTGEAGVPGAQVSVSGPASASGATNAEGVAEFTLPMRGEYEVEVFHQNFGFANRTVVFTETGQTKTEQFILRPKTGGMQIVLTTRDSDGHPISGATAAIDTFVTQRMTTDDNGGAVFRIVNAETFNPRNEPFVIQITHPDYVPNSVSVTPLPGGLDRVYNAPVTLTRKANKRFVIVHVLEKGTRQPIQNAGVTLVSLTGGSHSASTDGSGRANLTVDVATAYQLTVTTNRYQPVSDGVSFAGSGAPQTIERTYELTRDIQQTKKLRMVSVHVRGKKPDGASFPLSGAKVTLSSGHSGSTNADGQLEFLHEVAPGELLTGKAVPAEKTLKQGAGSVTVGVLGALLDAGEFENYEWFKSQLRFKPLQSALQPDFVGNWNRAFGSRGIDTIVIVCPFSTNTGKLDGDVIPSKGAVKIDEKVSVQVALLYSGGDDPQMAVTETVELFGPGNKLITSNLGSRTLTSDEYHRRSFDIVCHEPGTYQVKSTVKGPKNLVWTDKAAFVVSKDAAAATKPATGVFKLTNKVVGNAAPPDKGPYGTWSGSQSESSFTANYATTSSYEFNANLSANWSTPPASFKPGDIIELTSSASGAVTGKDRGSVGVEAGWYATGSVEILESSYAFAGRSPISGKDYPSGNGKVRFKVGTGGGIKLASWHGGCVWGTGGVWTPCEYTYVYEGPSTAGQPKTGTKTTMTPTSKQDPEKVLELQGGYTGTVELKSPVSAGQSESEVAFYVLGKPTNGRYKMNAAFTPTEAFSWQGTIEGTVTAADGRVVGQGRVRKPDGSYFSELDFQVALTGVYNERTNSFECVLSILSTDGSVNTTGRVVLKKE